MLRKRPTFDWRAHFYIGALIVKKASQQMRQEGYQIHRRGPDFVAPSGKAIELTTPGRVNAHLAKGGPYKTAEYSTYTRAWSKR